MHEIGTLFEIVHTVEKVAQQNDCAHVRYIALDLGDLTGMLPYFFHQYFPIATEGNPLFSGAELRINIITGIGKCNHCGEEYPIAVNEGTCPVCKSRDKTILSGTSLIIAEIGADVSSEGSDLA